MEFTAAGVLLLVPLIYLVIALGRVQAASFAATAGSVAAARVIADDPRNAGQREAARGVVDLALADQGLAGSRRTIDVDCTPECTSDGAIVRVRLEVEVVLPGVPAGIDAVLPVHVRVRAGASEKAVTG